MMTLSEKRQMMLDAIVAKAQGHVEVHKANVEIYLSNPAGIGEHSDVTEAVIAELDKMAAAYDRIEMIEKYFSKNDE